MADFDKIEKLLASINKTLEYHQQKSYDGSHLLYENFKKELEKIDEKISQGIEDITSKNIENGETYAKTINSWKAYATSSDPTGKDEFRKNLVKQYKRELFNAYKNSGVNATQAYAMASQMASVKDNAIKQQQDAILEGYLNLNDTLIDDIDKIKEIGRKQKEKLEKETNNDAWTNITGGYNKKVEQKGLERLFGEDSKIGKVGKLIQSSGKSAKAMSGSAGLIMMAIDKLIEGIELITANLKITAEESKVDFDLLTKEREIEGQKASAELNYWSQILQKEAEGEAKYYSALAQAEFGKYQGALDSKLMAFTDITGSAYKALETNIKYTYDVQKANVERSYEIGGENSKLANLTEKLGVELGETFSVLGGQGEVNQVARDRQNKRLENERLATNAGAASGTVGAVAGGVIGSIIGPEGTVAGAMAGTAVGSAVGYGVSKAVTGLKSSMDDFYFQQEEQGKNFNLQNLKIHQTYTNAAQASVTQLKDLTTDSLKEVEVAAIEVKKEEEMAYARLTQDVDKKWEIAENQANEVGILFGYVGDQMDSFKERMFNTQLVMSKWGKKMEDLQKIQESYSLSTGRNIGLTEEDYNSTFAMGTFWGDDVITELNSGMEIFNKSVADSDNMFFEMHKEVLKMGLNGKAFGKQLVKDLKLAEKYNFREGVKSLMEMSKWAQNVRFNTDSLGGMIDKVQTGGLEGIIKQSAELQVLGGNFAMGADPLAMAWESYMDPEAYAKRLNSMIAGQGTFNKRTGDVSFGIAQQQILRQYADSTGQDYKDVVNQARQQVKIREINKVVNPGQNFDEDQMAMIANKAQYKDGTWSVEVNGEKKSIEEIKPEDLKLMIDDSGKTLEETAIESLSVQRSQEALQQTMINDLMNNYQDFKTEHLERMNNVADDFIKHREEYRSKIYHYLDEATESQKTLASFYENITPDKIAEKFQAQIVTKLQGIQGQLTSIISEIGAKYDIQSDELTTLGNDHLLLNVKKMMDDMEGFDKAYEKLEDDGSRWYTDSDMVTTMDMLRADPTALLKVTDKTLQKQLAKLIYRWDDSWTTTDFDYKENVKLQNLINESFGKDMSSNNDWGGSKGWEDAPAAQSAGRAIGGAAGGYGTNGGMTEAYSRNVQYGHDGIIDQNGILTRIDNKDQVMAAKNGGPFDRMLDVIQTKIMPCPIPYDSFVSENPYSANQNINSNNNNNIIEIAPVEIKLSGNVQLSTPNGVTEIGQVLLQDPTFVRTISEMISIEVEKKFNGGRVIGTLNRGLNWSTK